MTDTVMREGRVELPSPKAPDPKSDRRSDIARGTEPSPASTGTAQSNGAGRGTASTTNRATCLSGYLAERIYVLALHQPWATLCVAPDPTNNGEPPKLYETRGWRPKLERPFRVAIHAAKKYDADVRYCLYKLPRYMDALRRLGFYDPNQPPPNPLRHQRPLVFGGIIGLATVVSVHSTEDRRLRDSLSEDDRTFGDWGPGRYAWRLADPILLPTPVQHTGRQQVLYDVPALERAAIFEQFR